MMQDVPEVLVAARRLALAYGKDVVLRDVDLEIRAGEFWGFLGPNASGKTTFLNAVLGMLLPSAGELFLSPALEGRARVGFVPQSASLNPWLPTSVEEFVLLGLVGLALDRRERAARLERALGRMGLAAQESTDYWSLSGGQRQRALIARALVREPLLLVLDEPMNHLDPEAEEELARDLLELRRGQGVTLIMVTHDTAMAARLATHIAFFAAGRVSRRPPPADGLAHAHSSPSPARGSGAEPRGA
jgi:ABC-type Mn2+/Zn2+ transport system ATPase subunit